MVDQHQVMLSYNWKCKKEMVNRFYEWANQGSRIRFWKDNHDGDNDHLDGVMASAIQDSRVIVLFLSNAYLKSVNCCKEISYAQSLEKEIIVVKLEKDLELQGKGAISSLIANTKLNIDFNDNEKAFFATIMKAIKRKFPKDITAPVDTIGTENENDVTDGYVDVKPSSWIFGTSKKVISLVVFAAMLIIGGIVAVILSVIEKPVCSADNYSIAVECSTEQIELTVPNCFYEQEDIEPDTTIVGETHTTDFKTHYSQDRYYYKVVFDNADQYESFHFDVDNDFDNDITIGFSKTQEHSGDKIEIVIGGWGGSASVIRSGNESPPDGHVKKYHTKLDFDVFKHFLQVTVADGIVQVFNGENEPFMEWRNPAINKTELINLLVSGGRGGYGTWKINAENRPKSKQEVSVCQRAAGSDFAQYFFTNTDCDINTTAINNTHINYRGKLTNAAENFELDFMCETTGKLVDDDDGDDVMLFLFSREDFFRKKFFLIWLVTELLFVNGVSISSKLNLTSRASRSQIQLGTRLEENIQYYDEDIHRPVTILHQHLLNSTESTPRLIGKKGELSTSVDMNDRRVYGSCGVTHANNFYFYGGEHAYKRKVLQLVDCVLTPVVPLLFDHIFGACGSSNGQIFLCFDYQLDSLRKCHRATHPHGPFRRTEYSTFDHRYTALATSYDGFLAVGSYSPDNVKAELFNFVTGSWTNVTDFPFGNGVISHYDMLFIPDVSAYFVIGGWNGWGNSATIAMFKKDVWSDVGHLSRARHSHRVTWASGAMVVAGGNGTLSSERCSLDEEKFVCNEMTPSLTDHEFGVSFLVPSDYCV